MTCRTRSPMSWPNSSLMVLNQSQSTNSSDSGRPYRLCRSSSRAPHLVEESPVVAAGQRIGDALAFSSACASLNAAFCPRSS